MELTGFRRENGRVGVRNHVIVLPVDDISNAAAEGVSSLVPDTRAIPHPYGRLQFGEDLELHFRTLIGTASNPNVAAAIIVGIEPNWTERVVEGIRSTGKPVAGFSIERHGDLETIRKASRKAQQFVQEASSQQREEIEFGDIWLSTKCGESDTTTGLASCPTTAQVIDPVVEAGGTAFFGETSELTGGEHLIEERCQNEEVREKFRQTYEDYIEMIMEKGADPFGSQPTQGNIRGGLSTIEEKALGNIEKTGTKQIVDVLAPAQTPTESGLNFMDTSSAAAECNTLMAAGGSVLHLFPTGQGNIVGHPIMPVIKLTGNPKTARTMSEHVDLDVSGLLSGEIELEEAGDMLMDVVEETINGKLTCAESLGHREFVLTKLYQSA